MRRDMPFGVEHSERDPPVWFIQGGTDGPRKPQFQPISRTCNRGYQSPHGFAGLGTVGRRRDLLQFQRTIVNGAGKVAIKEGSFNRLAGDE